MPFKYEENLQYGKDATKYSLIATAKQAKISVAKFGGQKILKVSREALVKLTEAAYSEVSFRLRPAHTKQVASILNDPEASQNDKLVALTMLQNSCVANQGVLPFCQDTGTASVFVKKGQNIWTGINDAEAISEGIYNAYTKLNLRYSQIAPLTMYDEVNTACNLPAQIDIYAAEGDHFDFLFVAKGGGSANKTYYWPMTKALLTLRILKSF